MYKDETLRALFIKAHDVKHHFESLNENDMHVSISCGNSKIGKVMNVSMMPGFSCRNCKNCLHLCYDIKADFRYVGTLYARVKNFVIAKKFRNKYFAEIRQRISRRRTNKYFRWHVAGDMIDYEYFAETVKIALEFPEFVFWTYTKMYSFVNRYVAENGIDSIPGNYHIMFSKWDGMPMDNPYNFPVFACRLKDGNVDEMPWHEMFKCPGNCDICKRENCGCIAGMNTYADEH